MLFYSQFLDLLGKVMLLNQRRPALWEAVHV